MLWDASLMTGIPSSACAAIEGDARRQGGAPGTRPRGRRSGGFLDFDLLGFAARRLRNGDFQHAVRHGGLNLRWIDPWRQLKHSIEHAVASFSEMVVLVLIVLLAFDLLLAP